MKKATWKKNNFQYSKIKNYTIWTLYDNQEVFSKYIKESFQEKNKEYKKTKIDVVSFNNYDDYYNTLLSSFAVWKAPDLFVLNNNDNLWWTIFEQNIVWIDPRIISVDDFRSKYETVFWNDLIESVVEETTKKWEEANVIEFLKWIPLGYEPLAIFYNIRYLKGKDISTWTSLNSAISYIKENFWNVIAISIWNWSTIHSIEDIFAQFLLQSWINSINNLDSKKLTQALSLFFYYASWDNAYNSIFAEMKQKDYNNLDLFSRQELAMIIWYPRLIKEINKRGYKRQFLKVSPISQDKKSSWNTLINYNYFVANKNSSNYDLSMNLLSFFASEDWQKAYLNNFDFYMPSRYSLRDSRFEKKIMDWYNIKYKDFYHPASTLSSFNMVLKTTYTREIRDILDLWATKAWYNYTKLVSFINCKYKKYIQFENLNSICKY